PGGCPRPGARAHQVGPDHRPTPGGAGQGRSAGLDPCRVGKSGPGKRCSLGVWPPGPPSLRHHGLRSGRARSPGAGAAARGVLLQAVLLLPSSTSSLADKPYDLQTPSYHHGLPLANTLDLSAYGAGTCAGTSCAPSVNLPSLMAMTVTPFCGTCVPLG